jgi:hypothetical protein
MIKLIVREQLFNIDMHVQLLNINGGTILSSELRYVAPTWTGIIFSSFSPSSVRSLVGRVSASRTLREEKISERSGAALRRPHALRAKKQKQATSTPLSLIAASLPCPSLEPSFLESVVSLADNRCQWQQASTRGTAAGSVTPIASCRPLFRSASRMVPRGRGRAATRWPGPARAASSSLDQPSPSIDDGSVGRKPACARRRPPAGAQAASEAATGRTRAGRSGKRSVPRVQVAKAPGGNENTRRAARRLSSPPPGSSSAGLLGLVVVTAAGLRRVTADTQAVPTGFTVP